MKYVHINLPEEYFCIKQVQCGDTVFINDNYRCAGEETESIYLQLKNQPVFQASQG